MNNLPMPIEPVSVPYVRPHAQKKTKKTSSVRLLLVVAVLIGGLLCAYYFLPNEIKNGFSAGFSEETTTQSAISETTTEAQTTESTLPETTTDLYQPQYALPEGAVAILPRDLSANTLGVFAENPTNAVLETVAPQFPKKNGETISVLIVNTHSFESYAADGAGWYTDPAFASNQAEENRVNAVAKALEAALEEHNIGAKFIDCMAESSLGSYKNAKSTLAYACKSYPDAVLVIDVHRALLMEDSGEMVRPVTEILGEMTAQVRILLGTGGNFRENAAAALAFYERANLEYPSLMMPLSVSENTFLQDCALPVLTLEIGSAGNSVSEAEHAAVFLASVLAMQME